MALWLACNASGKCTQYITNSTYKPILRVANAGADVIGCHVGHVTWKLGEKKSSGPRSLSPLIIDFIHDHGCGASLLLTSRYRSLFHRNLETIINNTRRMFSPLTTLVLLLSLFAQQQTHVEADEHQCRVSATGEKICEATSLLENKHENCDFWAERGECTANANWMKKNCAKACQALRPPEPTSADREQILELVKEYGEPQEAEGAEASATLLVIRQTISYMRNFVLRDQPTHTMTEDTIQKCRNRHDRCAFWSAIGECSNNAAWMASNCAPSCQSCHLIDFGESQEGEGEPKEDL